MAFSRRAEEPMRWFRVERARVYVGASEFGVGLGASQDEIEEAARDCVEIDYAITEIDGPGGDPLQ